MRGATVSLRLLNQSPGPKTTYRFKLGTQISLSYHCGDLSGFEGKLQWVALLFEVCFGHMTRKEQRTAEALLQQLQPSLTLYIAVSRFFIPILLSHTNALLTFPKQNHVEIMRAAVAVLVTPALTFMRLPLR